MGLLYRKRTGRWKDKSMIQRDDILSMEYLKKTEFNYFKTPEEKKQRAMFSFDEDGVVDAVGWMNDRLFENKKLWDEAPSRWDTYQM